MYLCKNCEDTVERSYTMDQHDEMNLNKASYGAITNMTENLDQVPNIDVSTYNHKRISKVRLFILSRFIMAVVLILYVSTRFGSLQMSSQESKSEELKLVYSLLHVKLQSK